MKQIENSNYYVTEDGNVINNKTQKILKPITIYVWVTCEPSENYFLNTILKPLKRKPCLIKLNS